MRLRKTAQYRAWLDWAPDEESSRFGHAGWCGFVEAHDDITLINGSDYFEICDKAAEVAEKGHRWWERHWVLSFDHTKRATAKACEEEKAAGMYDDCPYCNPVMDDESE